MQMLDVLKLALEQVRRIRPLVEQVRRHDGDLARQIKRAASSMVLNVGEGTYSAGRNAKARYATAAGSTAEVVVALKVALAWGYLEESHLEPELERFDRVLAMLWKLRH